MMQDSILIIDDKPDNVNLLSEALENEGYYVRISPNASHALNSINKKKPDIILLDIMMPEIDGFQFCETLKNNDDTKDITVLFLSALDELENKLKGLKLGGVDYITKPFNIEEVIARVKIHLKILHNSKKNAKTEKYIHSTLPDDQKDKILKKLLQYMKEEKPYLNNDFCIDQASENLKIRKHYISEVINLKLNKNFNLFVNEYRISHVIKLISENKHKKITLLALAFESGFNSKATFNIVFKKIMNMSPREYIKHLNLD